MTFFESLEFDFIDFLGFKDRPFKAKLIPAKIWLDLKSLKNKDLELIKYFKKFKTKIVFKEPKEEHDPAYPYIGGEYYDYLTKAGNHKRYIQIIIYCNNYNTYKFNQKSWKMFRVMIIQAIMHELIHYRIGTHYRYVGHIKHDDQEVNGDLKYYSDTDEIKAFSNCIYTDLKIFRPKTSIVDLLRNSIKSARRCSPTFHRILKKFDYNFDNKALPLYIKEILRWDRKYNEFLVERTIPINT